MPFCRKDEQNLGNLVFYQDFSDSPKRLKQVIKIFC